MKLIVGIGNPGPEYDRTRHNVGFDVLDRLACRLASGETARSRFQSVVIESTFCGEKLLLARPTTYVNRSGQSVQEALAFFKAVPENDLLVIVDDVALPCGTIRARAGGGAGGHNGLRDVSSRLGTQHYARIRIGIDDPGVIPLEKYVLGGFTPQQREAIEPALDLAADAAMEWLEHGIDDTMNRFNTTNTASIADHTED
jgi:PTH1 family peptidyl-tRNA hydrolase